MRHHHKVTGALVRELRRLAASGASEFAAARAIGCSPDWLKGFARDQRIRFAPWHNRGVPEWLMPELARRAEDRLRATWEIVQCR